ncbi:MAG TPA: MerR family transcriptional regulator [Acidimicrobiales bacterium]|nr:MerR family transcriptional regulator [Acidimicrobiales bacterium]
MLTIGQLAGEAGVNIETVRYYERRGLLREPPRTSAGYRQYSATDIWRLQFIARAKELGFTLAEITTLLGPHSGSSADAVLTMARVKMSELPVPRSGVKEPTVETSVMQPGSDTLRSAGMKCTWRSGSPIDVWPRRPVRTPHGGPLHGLGWTGRMNVVCGRRPDQGLPAGHCTASLVRRRKPR